jgi:hypothetical protein
VNGSKKTLESSITERTAAEKALAQKQAPFADAQARAQSLKAEFEALSAERKRSDASRNGLAATQSAK